jgi:hypothetical protein
MKTTANKVYIAYPKGYAPYTKRYDSPRSIVDIGKSLQDVDGVKLKNRILPRPAGKRVDS